MRMHVSLHNHHGMLLQPYAGSVTIAGVSVVHIHVSKRSSPKQNCRAKSGCTAAAQQSYKQP